MTWVRLDDHFDEHPKMKAAGPFGLALWVAAIAYCNRNLTDGFVPRGIAAHLLHDEWVDFEDHLWKAAMTCGMRGEDLDLLEIADHLVDVGLFEDADRGYRVHDYLDYQPSKAEVLDIRAKRSVAGKKGAAVRYGKSDGKQLASG